MNCIEFKSTVGMTDEEFTEIHRTHLGISQLGAVAGLVSYTPPIMVYLEKVGAPENDNNGNERLLWGKIHEATIANEYARRTGDRLLNPEMIYVHKEYPWLIGTPDRIILNEKYEPVGILEIKTASEFMKGAWEDGKIPSGYELQAHMYMHFFDLSYAVLACLIGGNRLEIRLIERNREIEKYALEIAKDFWERVETKNPPELIGVDGESAALNEIFGEPKDTEINIAEKAELIREYQDTCEQWGVLDKKKKALADEILMSVGDNLIGNAGNVRVKVPQYKTSRIDTDTLKKEMPDIYQRYVRTSSYRRIFIMK